MSYTVFNEDLCVDEIIQEDDSEIAIFDKDLVIKRIIQKEVDK